MSAAGESGGMRLAPSVGVKEGNGVEFDGFARDLQRDGDIERVKIDVAVREHHAFGIGGGSAGVEELGERVLVHLHHVALKDVGALEEVFIVLASYPACLWFCVEEDEALHRAS